MIGLQGDAAGLADLERAIDAAFDSGLEPALVMTSDPVSMLFGSLAPSIAKSDLETLLRALRDAEPAPMLHEQLDRLAKAAPAEDVAGLSDGPAGSQLGDGLVELLRKKGGEVEPGSWLRFTLAHELAHLVYDRLAGTWLAQASGPWTPPGRESRANAVAAALLMPENDPRWAWSADPDRAPRTASGSWLEASGSESRRRFDG